MSFQSHKFAPLQRLRFIMAGLPFIIALLFAACEDDRFDHDPPSGQGTLYVDNRTGDDLKVFINGTRVKDVDSGDYRYYDLDPGVYRVVLDGEDTPRSFSGDIDILADQKTIMEVEPSLDDYRRFDIFIYYR